MRPQPQESKTTQFRVMTTNRWLDWFMNYYPNRKEKPYTTLISLSPYTVSNHMGTDKFNEFQKYYCGIQFNHEYDFIEHIPEYICEDMPEELLEFISQEKVEKIVDLTPQPLPNRYIYFIGFGEYIKVGISVNVKKRINELQVGAPEKLICFGYMIGDEKTEKKYHKKLNQYNTNGEWFKIQFQAAIEILDIKEKVIIPK